MPYAMTNKNPLKVVISGFIEINYSFFMDDFIITVISGFIIS